MPWARMTFAVEFFDQLAILGTLPELFAVEELPKFLRRDENSRFFRNHGFRPTFGHSRPLAAISLSRDIA